MVTSGVELPKTRGSPPVSADDPMHGQPRGLVHDEADRRLKTDEPNAMPDTSAHPWRDALGKLWAPVPWMLKAAIVLQLVLVKDVEAAMIAVPLLVNAGLGLFQESRA